MKSRQASLRAVFQVIDLAHLSFLLIFKNRTPCNERLYQSLTEDFFLNEFLVLQMTSRQGSLGVAFRPTDQELLCLLRERLESGTGHDNVEDLPKTVSAIDPDSIKGSTG